MNLCSNDGQRIFDACVFGVLAVGALGSLAGAAYSIYLLGWWGIVGFVTFFLFMPVQVGIHCSIYICQKVIYYVTLEIEAQSIFSVNIFTNSYLDTSKYVGSASPIITLTL